VNQRDVQGSSSGNLELGLNPVRSPWPVSFGLAEERGQPVEAPRIGIYWESELRVMKAWWLGKGVAEIRRLAVRH
jgi:hypothetical protein